MALPNLLASLSLSPNEQPSTSDSWSHSQSLQDFLLSSNVDALRKILSSRSSGVLVTGADRYTRCAIVTKACPSVKMISACSYVVDPASSPAVVTSDSISSHDIVCIDDVDFQDAIVETRVKTMFPTLPNERIVIGLAATDVGVPAALRRPNRFDVIYRISPLDITLREVAWRIIVAHFSHWYVFFVPPHDAPSQLAVMSPGYGLSDFAHVCHLFQARAAYTDEDNQNVQSSSCFKALEEAVLAHRPLQSSVDLPFVTAGGSATVLTSSGQCSSWQNHGGYVRAKHALTRLIEWPVTHAETFERLGIRPPHGLLLHGPHGCGKTTLALAFAARLRHANWLYVAADDLFTMFLGESEARVRTLFARARALAPCVVLLDDADALGRGRDEAATGGNGGSHAVEGRVLAALLTELDGAADGGDVFVVACVRDVKGLDAALIRPGRLDNFVELGLPTLEDRVEILRVVLKGMSVEGGVLGCEQVVKKLADLTEGLTGAEIDWVCREAGVIALDEVKDDREMVEFIPTELFERAIAKHRRKSAAST